MSQIVTPPDILSEHTVYLVINAHEWDIEMIMRWLHFSSKKYTIYVYHDTMDDPEWLCKVAKDSESIFINRQRAPDMTPLLDFTNKIQWFGEEQLYPSAVESLIKYG